MRVGVGDEVGSDSVIVSLTSLSAGWDVDVTVSVEFVPVKTRGETKLSEPYCSQSGHVPSPRHSA